MEYTQTIIGNKCNVVVSGKFTFSDHMSFKKIFEIFNSDEVKNLEIDVKNVTFVDSAALGILLLLRDNCNRNDVALTILKPKDQVQKMFKISRFYDLFKIID